ncbi:MAG: PQQ-binding-like beta-propeller repeat protein [Saprospiraceae bacterium]
MLLTVGFSHVVAQEGTWATQAEGAVYATALSADGTVQIVGTRDASVNAYDANGVSIWQFTAESTVWSVSTSTDGSHTAVASEDRRVYLLDNQGKPQWNFRSTRIYRDVAISSEAAYVVASDENRDLYALDGATGTVIWKKRLRDIADTVAIYGDEAHNTLVGSRDAYLTSYSRTGDSQWQVRFDTDVIDAAITQDGVRGVIATLDGLITMINGADGSIIWQKPPPQAIRCTNRDRNTCLRVDISDDGNRVIIGTLDGTVYLINAADGSVLQQQSLGNSITSVCISGDAKTLLYGDRDGLARSLRSANGAASFAAQQEQQRAFIIGSFLAVVVIIGMLIFWMRRTKIGRNFWQVRSVRPRILLRQMWRSRISYLLILPTLVLLLIFNYYPAGSGVYHAFTKWNPGIETRWIGLENFQSLVNSPYFFVGIRNAATLAVAAFLKLLIPLLVAELIFHIRNQFVGYSMRTLFVIPLVLPSVVTILLWVNIYDPNIGLLNQSLHALGLDQLARSWLGNSDTALPAIITIGFPWVSPFALLVFYGGLVSIPDELFDAAKVDGANAWTRFWRIDIPMLMGQVRLLAILAFIGSMQEFQSIFLTTGGGPGNVTYTPALELYYQATRFNNFGLASAMGAILFFVILGGTILNLRSVRSQTEYRPE